MANPTTNEGPILTIRVLVEGDNSVELDPAIEDFEFVFQKPVPSSIKNMEIKYRFQDEDSVYGDEQTFVIPLNAN